MIGVTEGLSLDEREIEERFARASGPGGRYVQQGRDGRRTQIGSQRTSSLPEPIKVRLRRLAGQRVTVDGVLVIQAREHRTQARNREAARARLVKMLQEAARRPKSSSPHQTRRPRAREKRLVAKHKRSETKRQRGRGTSDV